MEELLSKNECPMNTDNGSTSAPFFLNNERKINESIYLALREHAIGDAKKELDEMNDITNIEVDLHTTTCKIDGQNILSYGIRQSTGNFGTSFSNGYAGCGPVAIAAIFMQQNVHPSKIDSQWTSWDMFEKQYFDYEPSIGYSYKYSSLGETKFSGFLRNIASQCGAHYFKEGTAVSRNHMGDFLKKHFKMIGTDVEYKDSRVKKQIDRNRLEIVYGRSHGGISGWFNQHYWVVSAYATVKCGTKTSTLVYNNTSWKDGDGWYTIGNRIGYRHKGKLFEPGDPK